MRRSFCASAKTKGYDSDEQNVFFHLISSPMAFSKAALSVFHLYKESW
jgi:hypothetical protein